MKKYKHNDVIPEDTKCFFGCGKKGSYKNSLGLIICNKNWRECKALPPNSFLKDKNFDHNK